MRYLLLAGDNVSMSDSEASLFSDVFSFGANRLFTNSCKFREALVCSFQSMYENAEHILLALLVTTNSIVFQSILFTECLCYF